MNKDPMVSILTPVYNGEAFLAECIESVLRQTYTRYEYIILDNCSTDRSLEIAQRYACEDGRLRVHRSKAHVGVIENHNNAFRLISSASKYCKVVSGDDFIFPDCVMRMVECAEANPSVGVVGSYQISGEAVRWQGLRYPSVVVPGREMCRRIFLGGQPSFGFGSPTSIMYRADVVRSSESFYPNSSPHADTSACFKVLNKVDFGFVYQVLSYERTHEATQSYRSQELNRYSSAYLSDVLSYGALYLSEKEANQVLTRTLRSYYKFLSINYIGGGRDAAFWSYHRQRLKELGYPLRRVMLLRAAIRTLLEELVKPAEAFMKCRARMKRNVPEQEEGWAAISH